MKLSFRTKTESFIRATLSSDSNRHNVSSACQTQTNDLTERFNQTLQASRIKVVNSSQDD